MRSGVTDRLPPMGELDDARCRKYDPAAARSVEKHQRAGLETATAPTEESERAPMSIFKLRHYTTRFRMSQRFRYRLPRVVWQFLIRPMARTRFGGAPRGR
jgi:hypothetical protein